MREIRAACAVPRRAWRLSSSGAGWSRNGSNRPVGSGEIQRALDRASGGGRVAEGVARDRLQQEGLNRPAAGFHDRGGAVEDGRERGGGRLRAVLGEPQRRQGEMCLSGLALGRVHLAQGLFDALRLAQSYPGVQQERSCLGGECVMGSDPSGQALGALEGSQRVLVTAARELKHPAVVAEAQPGHRIGLLADDTLPCSSQGAASSSRPCQSICEPNATHAAAATGSSVQPWRRASSIACVPLSAATGDGS